MISSIEIRPFASFKGLNHLRDLAQINFVYGCNATGKTTISKLIAGDPAILPFGTVTWKNGRPLQAIVYNQEFVRSQFAAVKELPGIYTLGSTNVALLEQIDGVKVNVDAALKKIELLTTQLTSPLILAPGLVEQSAELTEDFKTRCWSQKQKHEGDFKEALVGSLKSEPFMRRVLDEKLNNKSPLEKDLAVIKAKAAVVYDDKLKTVKRLAALDIAALTKLESTAVLAEKVIGKKDVDIGKLIETLNNSDWVTKGREYLDKSDEKCPFCQQKLPEGLKETLEGYFDTTFETAMRAISELETIYTREAKVLKDALQSIATTAPEGFLDTTRFKDSQLVINGRLDANLSLINQKKEKPSNDVFLASIADACASAISLITESNASIDKNNTTFHNLGKEKDKLEKMVWKYIVDVELDADITMYVERKKKLETSIGEQRQRIKDAEEEKKRLIFELNTLERSTVNIKDAVDRINEVLTKFCFDNFKLEIGPGGGTYSLVREDGSPAKDTLSEGEKTLITFLYFYHLVNGSSTDSGIAVDRVVVFDDPVSSLDEQALFIIGILIRTLMGTIVAGTTHVKQLIVLTHNVGFHLQIAYKTKNKGGGSRKYWTIRKADGTSVIKEHPTDPVKSSYDMLWSEIRRTDHSVDTLRFLQNQMRVILETYFKDFGGITLEDLATAFEGTDLIACEVLVAWAHDGSHHAADDVHRPAFGSGSVEMFMKVFKTIFEKTGHGAHYDMMITQTIAPVTPAVMAPPTAPPPPATIPMPAAAKVD